MKMIAFRPTASEPMPACGFVRSQWQVGRRTVTMTQMVGVVPGSFGELRVEWEPGVPRHGLSKREWREYRQGRDAHCQRVANIINGNVACFEV